jgi:hypothetical protein
MPLRRRVLLDDQEPRQALHWRLASGPRPRKYQPQMRGQRRRQRRQLAGLCSRSRWAAACHGRRLCLARQATSTSPSHPRRRGPAGSRAPRLAVLIPSVNRCGRAIAPSFSNAPESAFQGSPADAPGKDHHRACCLRLGGTRPAERRMGQRNPLPLPCLVPLNQYPRSLGRTSPLLVCNKQSDMRQVPFGRLLDPASYAVKVLGDREAGPAGKWHDGHRVRR